jgi:hypothetical protein
MTQKVYRLINASILGASSTSKVKVSATDNTENFLSSKIEAGTGVSTAITDVSGNQKLQISADVANIDHNSLQNYDVDEHRLLDDTQTTATNLWSAEKISDEIEAGDEATLDAAKVYTDDQIAAIPPVDLSAIEQSIADLEQADIGLEGRLDTIEAALPNKADLVDGIIPANQLPSYVDDVLEFADLISFPVEGETGKIYVALDTNKCYRWSGSTYIQITSGGVDLVNGQSGIVVLESNDINLSTTVNGQTNIQGSLEDHESRIDTLESGGGDSKQVKVSPNDTTEGFLEDKVVGASGKIVISTLQEGADEDLQISIGADVFDKTVNTTDNITEGSTNVFFTEQRAKDAAVSNAIVEGVTDVAPSQDAVFQALASASEGLSNHIDQETGAHAASAISFDDQVSELDAEDVQAAIEKLSENDDLKVAKAGDTMTGTLQFEIDKYNPYSAIVVNGSTGPELEDQIFVEPNSIIIDKYFVGEYVNTSALDAVGLYVTSLKDNITTKESILNSDKLQVIKSLPDSDGPGFNIETVGGQILLQTKTTNLFLPSIPTNPSHVTNKSYVDDTINSTVATAVTQLEFKLKIPQAIYVNNNPILTGYVATGSIQKPYQTIKAALDSISDASSSKRYCLIIAPGTYNELNTIRLKGFVDLISIANDTVIITVAGGSRLLWSNNSPGRVFISNISISNGVEVLNDNPTGTSGCVLDLDNVDTGTVIFNGRGGGRDFIQLRNDTRLSGSCTINSAATTIFDSTIIGNLNLTDIGCVAPDGFGSAITATLRSNYQLNVNITSTSFDIYVDAWGNNNVSTLTMTSNSAIPSTFNSDASSYPNTITLSGSPAPVVARTTQARSISVNPINGISSTNVQAALEELQSEIQAVDLSVSSEPTGYLDASQTTISFTDSSPDRTFSISPVSGSFVFYANGERFTKTTPQSVQIPDQEGNHYIYFDVDGILKSTQVFDDSIILTKAFTAIVYWDADNSKHVYFANERHGLVMDGQSHLHFHTVFGAQYISGLALENFTIGDGSSNANAQYTADEGVIRDEDLKIEILAQAQIPTLYRLGASGNWRRKEVDSYPFIYSGTAGYTGASGRLPFNELTGGSWQLTEIPNNGFVLVHYFATNDIEYPIVAIQGQATYNTIVAARTSANSEISQLSGLPFAEFVPIGSVILESSGSYTNDVKARVRLTDTGSNYVDFRGSQILVAAATANDHGLLSGLSSDDHIQYHTDSRADTWLGTKTTDNLTQGTNNLYLKINTLSPASGLNAANDDLVIYSDADSAHRRIKLNQLTSAVGSAGDIAETTTVFLNNVSTPTNVSGLAFSAAVVSSFEAQVVVSRGTKKEVFSLLGVQIDGDFSMSVESIGVNTGIDFTISDVGQVKYTSTDDIDGGTIKFRATTLTV